MNRLKNIVWIRLLAAFLIALSMWIYVDITTNPSKSRTIELEVHFDNMPENVLVVDENGLERAAYPRIKVDVTASQATLNVINEGVNIRASVDCTGVGKGQQTFDVLVKADDSLGYVKPEAQIKQLTLRFDRKISKPFNIVRNSGGDVIPDGQYEPEVTVLSPATGSVTYTGPADIIDAIDHAEYLFSLSSFTTEEPRSGIEIYPVTKEGKKLTGVKSDTPEITIRVKMNPAARSRNVVVKPAITGVVAPGFQITNVEVISPTVEITGSADAIDAIKNVETEAIDVRNLSTNLEGEYRLRVPQYEEKPLTLAFSSVLVRISVAPLTNTLRLKIPFAVTITDIPDGMFFRVEPATVLLDLSVGPDTPQRGLGTVEASVSVGSWDPTNPSRQVVVRKPTDVTLQNRLPLVQLIPIAAAAANEPTPTPADPGTDGTPSPTVDVPSPTEGSPTPTASVPIATSTPTTALPSPTPTLEP